jgi:hypothetical protein
MGRGMWRKAEDAILVLVSSHALSWASRLIEEQMPRAALLQAGGSFRSQDLRHALCASRATFSRIPF